MVKKEEAFFIGAAGVAGAAALYYFISRGRPPIPQEMVTINSAEFIALKAGTVDITSAEFIALKAGTVDITLAEFIVLKAGSVSINSAEFIAF